jgi:NB-ARC domain
VTQTVALHGLGGVGKTQLATEYAWKHLGGYEAVLWVRADSPETLEASLAGIAGVLGLPEVSVKEQDVQTDAVLRWLKGHERWLLIADNADTDEAARAARYPASVAKTWDITLERLNPLARALLRFATWFGPDAIPRGIFSADPTTLPEGLGESVEDLDLAIEEALGELARFSLIRLTLEAVSVHRLLQAVEQDALTKEECARWLEWAVRLFSAFAPKSPSDIRTWSIWLTLRPHAEALIKNTQSHGMNATPVGILASQYAVFLYARANYTLAEPLMRRALAIDEAPVSVLGIGWQDVMIQSSEEQGTW